MGGRKKEPVQGTLPERGPDDLPTATYGDTLKTPEPGGVAADHEFPEVDPDAYEISGEFARGGLGRILEARDRRLERSVALKELLTREKRAEARFIREALITARLEHPSIVPIHEAGRWPNGQRFYSMKLVEGRTLSDALEQAVSREERLALLPHVIDVADAVAYAHSEGVLHRDLKPSNVLVGAFGETLLIDWGLAKDLRDPTDSAESLPPVSSSGTTFETSDGIVVGTPPYMPPEQAAAKPLDPRSDVYSIGAMLYQVLCGHRPYEDEEPNQVLRAVVSYPPRPLAELAPDVPVDLVAIVEKAMARDPADRYPSAREMADELRRFTAGQLVAAHDYSLWEITKRFVRKQQAAVLTAGFALMVLVVGGIWSFVNIREERNQARANADLARAQVEQLKLEKARSLLATDPTMALAWEKRLAAPLPGAASVAAEAIDRGVALHVLEGHVDRVLKVVASPIGGEVATASQDGTIRLWDTKSGAGRVLSGHSARVSSIDFSADGHLLASGSHDRTVRIWDVKRGEARVLDGHEGAVMHVTFSRDGRLLASSSEDGTVRLWRVEDGRSVRVLKTPQARTVMAAFSPDGSALVSGGHGERVIWWDVATGEKTELAGHTGSVTHVAFSPDGETFASAGADEVVRLWSVATKRSIALAGHEEGALFVAYAPDGGRIASAGRDGTVRIFSVDGHRLRVLRGHAERVRELAFSPSGHRLASASWDKSVRVWDLETGESAVLLGHDDVVSSVAFSPDSLVLASGSWDERVRIWGFEPYRRRVFPEHEIGVHGVDISPDGRLLASGGHDNVVRIYDLDSGTSRAFEGHLDHIFRVRFSPGGQWVASSSDDQTVRLWNVLDGSSVVLEGHRADVEEITFSADGRWLASAGEDDLVYLWEVATHQGRALEGHTRAVTSVAFDPNGRWLASASRDGTARLWRVGAAGSPQILDGHEDEVWDVDFSPDGLEVATVSLDGTARVFHAQDGALLRVYRNLGRMRMIAYSPTGDRIAVGGDGLWLCDVETVVCQRLKGHTAEVQDLAFDAEGAALVTGASDDTVRLWDVETLESHVLRGHRAAVFDVAVSRQGDLIASGSSDSDVRIWPFVLPPKPENLATWLEEKTSVTVRE